MIIDNAVPFATRSLSSTILHLPMGDVILATSVWYQLLMTCTSGAGTRLSWPTRQLKCLMPGDVIICVRSALTFCTVTVQLLLKRRSHGLEALVLFTEAKRGAANQTKVGI